MAQALLRRLDPETAHDLSLWLLRCGLGPRSPGPDDPILAIRVWGREFPNPIGLAAGFDKNAAVVGTMMGLGFGFNEVGTITPAPQPGNGEVLLCSNTFHRRRTPGPRARVCTRSSGSDWRG